MSSDRKLAVVFGGVSLGKCRIQNANQIMVQIAQDLSQYLTRDVFLERAEFDLVNGVIRFGSVDDPFVQVGPVDRRNRELPITVEVNADRLRGCTDDHTREAFLSVIVPNLFKVATDFDLPTDGLIEFANANGFQISIETDLQS